MELIQNKQEVLNMQKATLAEVGKQGAVADLEEGTKDPSELLITARKAVEILTAYIGQIKEAVHTEIYHHDNNTIEAFGATIELGSTGDRLDYEKDHEYFIRKKALKDREDLLKLAFKSDDTIVDGDGGIVEKVPLKSASKEILKIKL